LGAAVRRANERVLAEAERDPTCHGMATTLSALFLWGGVAHVAHVGDCRIYRWCPGRPLRRLTRDHNRAQSLVDQDVITEEQAANHPWSHQLERALGVQLSVDADLTSEECRPDDRFLLCSDGLIRVVREEEIASVLGAPSTPRGQVEHLVSLARARGAPDNVTVIALHCRAFAMGEASHADETVDPG
jgi:protein phosphatase